MEYLFGILLLVVTAVLAVIQFVRNVKYSSMADERTRMCPWILVSACMALAADLCTAGTDSLHLSSDLMFPITCLILLVSSLWHYNKIRWLVSLLTGLEIIQSIYYLLHIADILPPLPSCVSLSVFLAALIVTALQFVLGVGNRMHSIKEVMKSGTIWTNVVLSVDAIYPILILLNSVTYLFFSCLLDSLDGVYSFFTLILNGSTLAALALRVYMDSAFVLWQNQERRIVESMKVTSVESATDISRIDDVYKDIYERIIAFFEKEKPFLDSNLTINEVVRSLYTNKLYISRAISQFTGRNFCQFVNYYRVTYSMHCFRENPDLKMHELAAMSGFNSIVSYNMAFRLFMGENPSEWSRKEKTRKIKTPK